MSRNKIEVYSYKGSRGSLSWWKVLLALVLAGALAFAALLGAVLWGAHDQIQGAPQEMIVLGCQVRQDGPSALLRDRLDETLNYWEDHGEVLIVVSGGQGPDEPTTEARAMADYLTSAGVPEDQILLEEASHNTFQNFLNSRALLDQADIDLSQGVLVVSNDFHLTRARMLAERTGFREVSTLAAPSSDLPSRLYMYVREPLALVKSFLLDR